MKHLLGIEVQGHTLPELARDIYNNIGDADALTLTMGFGTLVFLIWARMSLTSLLKRLGMPPQTASVLAKTAPAFGVVTCALLVWIFDLHLQGLAVVGQVPQGLPSLVLPSFDQQMWMALLVPAIMISSVGYVETISVAQTLAAKRREAINPNQELIALGAANIGAGVSGGFPVTGGFSRSVVNFDAGAVTPMAGVLTAVGIAAAAMYFSAALFYLPKVTLAATIIVAVLSLVDVNLIKKTWAYSGSDFAAMSATIGGTLLFGVETGITLGVGLSLFLFLFRTSRPHVAVVGRVPGTEHFRNVLRHDVETDPKILSLRVDESLFFPNARRLENTVNSQIALRPDVRHVILMCSAVNDIDSSALESLEHIEQRLSSAGLSFYLSEVKGPVQDKLRGTELVEQLSGKIFLSHSQAIDYVAHRQNGWCN